MDNNIFFKCFDLMDSIPFLEGHVLLQAIILTIITVFIITVLSYLVCDIFCLYDEGKRKREVKENKEQNKEQLYAIKEDVLKEYLNEDIILSIPKEMRNNTLRWQANVFKVSYEDLERHIDKYIIHFKSSYVYRPFSFGNCKF